MDRNIAILVALRHKAEAEKGIQERFQTRQAFRLNVQKQTSRNAAVILVFKSAVGRNSAESVRQSLEYPGSAEHKHIFSISETFSVKIRS